MNDAERAERHELIKAFVAELTPMVRNETHAWNLWSFIASNDGAIKTALETIWHEPLPLIACPHWEPGQITMRKGCTACAADHERGNKGQDA